MELSRYNYFDPATNQLDPAQPQKVSYDVFKDGETPSDYTIVTDIVEFAKAGGYVSHLMDRLSVRRGLKSLIATKMGISVESDWEDQAKFDLLTDEEKSVSCHWFITQKESFKIEVNNDAAYWEKESGDYREWTCSARIARAVKIQSLIFERMVNVNDAIAMIDYAPELWEKYHKGVESLSGDGVEGLRDYLNSEAGTSYANNGFRGTQHPFNGSHTANTVADELISIIDA